MNPEHYQRVKKVFQEAVECEPEGREMLLADACAGDEELRREVESLLSYAKRAEVFIEKSAFEVGARLMARDGVESLEGRRVGQYKLLGELGHGGMGVVYRAARADDQFQKEVAIKIVRLGLDTQEIRRRFRYERQILASLDHPNIAKLLDGGTTEDGLPYLVMDFVAGVPINQYCNRHKLSTNERLKIFRMVCSAVQYAHQRLVIHRDIKPGNILVTEEGVPKLLDFGIAKLLDPAISEALGHTATDVRIMTPEYASPEQVRGEEITTASDVYSLGVLLYELLTGHRPYRLTSRRSDEIARAICDQDPERPSNAVSRVEEIASPDNPGHTKITPQSVSDNRNEQPEKLRRQLSGDLDNIVLMALHKEPERRYSSVTQLSEDIHRHLDGLPVVARKDTFAYRSGKFVRRHRAGVAAAALVLLTMIAGIVLTAWQARVAKAQARIAAEQRDRARIEKAKAEEINTFLQDMLGFANPGWYSPNTQKGSDITVKEALDDVARRVETEFVQQPEVRAELLRNIGTSYLFQSRFDLAERYLQAALATQLPLYGENHASTARTLLHLGEARFLTGDAKGAESFLQRALAAYRQQQRESAAETRWLAAALVDYGNTKMLQGDSKAAETLFREALQFAPQLKGRERALVGLITSGLAGAVINRGEYAEGEALYRTSIEEFRRLPGRERFEIGIGLTYLGELLALKGELAEAEALLREGEEIYRRTIGETTIYFCQNQSMQAFELFLKGDYRMAEQKISKAFEILRQIYPKVNIFYAGPMTTRGRILDKTRRSTQAEAILREALKLRDDTLPKGHYHTAITKGALGECLLTQSRFAEAEPFLVESYDVIRVNLGERNIRTLETLRRLVKLYESWKKPDLAGRYRALLAGG